MLVQHDFETARKQTKQSILNFLAFNRVDDSIYHETMTSAWLRAVQHFMYISEPVSASEAFIAANKVLLDKEIMYTYYTHQLMESKEAKHHVLEPDLELIPLHG